ncbi:DNA topoisomerase 2-like [Culex pipiens pallens]|uniref:DNA topoisomerase 2-like n=1 Tax=Culex pipiens pallens TaxID=42434 RepID=UPI0022AAF3FF|nr:DNA topoisomerase 2-like [Culex pipiens pallens]XP_052563812.1 DNA topoisomerase 2-like [Culex pipiens pallens]
MLKLKENMKLQVKSFCSKCVMSEKFVAAVLKRGIVELVLQWAKFKAQTELSKASGSKKSKIQSVPKLEDANDAGTKYSEERYLHKKTTRAIFYKKIINPDLDLFSNSDNVRA